MFAAPPLADYHLQVGSPCVDAADPSPPDLPATDLDGRDRIIGSAPDMGAYETVLNRAPIADAGPDQTLEGNATGGSLVTLDGSGSSDPDGDPLSCFWTWTDATGDHAAAAVPAPLGVQVSFTLSAPGAVSARVLNIGGRLVRTLCSSRDCASGTGTLLWNARSDAGLVVPAGAYLVELSVRATDGSRARAIAPLQLHR